tara:strand:- start:5313 stop:6416 length:1104 start_codon:yes stop_codon:yes gene_type:complete
MSERVMEIEYIWLDGYDVSNLRSRTRYIKQSGNDRNLELSDLPEWSHDGSSTNQAEVSNSDMILKPVKLYISKSEPTRGYALCEVYNTKGKPHISNSRVDLAKLMDSDKNFSNLTFGIEQEYVFIEPKQSQPWQWPTRWDDEEKMEKTFFPGPQGRYYCGTGNFVRGRNVVREHARRCHDIGLELTGTNAEVMLSQWEYQLGPQNPLDLADDMWMARYLYEQIAEEKGFAVEYFPKLFRDNDDWAGTGCHINFSTPTLREGGDNKRYIDDLLVGISEDHKKHIKVYGAGNEFRLNGKNETSHIDSFEWGDGDRTVAMRIPHGANYIEDRRPGGNINPYEAFTALAESILRVDSELSTKTSKKEKATA